MATQTTILTPMDPLHYSLEGVFSTTQILNEEEKNAIYTLGYVLYTQEKYSEALPFFTLLKLSEPDKLVYYIALAACYKMSKNYTAAMDHYSLAITLAPERVEHIIDIAECQIAALMVEEAIQTLNEFLARSVATPFEQTLIRRAETLLALLETEGTPKKK